MTPDLNSWSIRSQNDINYLNMNLFKDNAIYKLVLLSQDVFRKR